MADIIPSKYKRLQKKRQRRAKRGKMYNEDYERKLRERGYSIVKSEPTGEGHRLYQIEKDGRGSSVLRSDNPMPEGKQPRMKVVKKAPRYSMRKHRMTKRKTGGFI